MAVSPLDPARVPPALSFRVAAALSVLLVLLAAGVALWRDVAPQPEVAVAAADALRLTEAVSRTLGLEAVRVSGSTLSDFDTLSRSSAALDRAHEALIDAADALAPTVPRSELSPLMLELAVSVRLQSGAVERFKTGVAVVRNSRRYLPLASAEVAIEPGVSRAVVDRVRALASSLELFAAAPDEVEELRLLSSTEVLRSEASRLAPDAHRLVVNFTHHADALLSRQRDVAGSLAASASDGVEASLAPLAVRIRGVASAARRVRDTARSAWSFLCAMALALWAAYIIARLRRPVRAPRGPGPLETLMPASSDAREARLRWWLGAAATAFAFASSRATDQLALWRNAHSGVGPEAARVVYDLHAISEYARLMGGAAFADDTARSVELDLHALLTEVSHGPLAARLHLEPRTRSDPVVRVRGTPGRLRAALDTAVDAVLEVSEPAAAATLSCEGSVVWVRGSGGGSCAVPSSAPGAPFGSFAVACGLAGVCGATIEAVEGPALQLHFPPVD